jgi:hypothetical protein
MDATANQAKLRKALLTIKMDMVYRGVPREAAEAKFRENVSVPEPQPAVSPAPPK